MTESPSPPGRVLPAAAGARRAATVAGRVVLSGEEPEPRTFEVRTDPELCGRRIVVEAARVGRDRGVADVAVWLQPVAGAPEVRSRRARRFHLTNRNCRFAPAVLVAPVGSVVELTNEDPVLHTVHAYRGRATVFNVALPVPTASVLRTLEQPGQLLLLCDRHPWMQATIFVVPSAHFGRTDISGAFLLEDVPPGRYVLRAEHPRLGAARRRLTLPPGARVVLELELGHP